MQAYYVAAHHTIKNKNINYGNPYPKKYVNTLPTWKNKRIETVTSSMSAAIEPELYCKITPMYKCCWHWTNQCPINKQCQKQTRTMTCSKSANTPQMQGRQNQWHMCYWHETNQYMVSKQVRKQYPEQWPV